MVHAGCWVGVVLANFTKGVGRERYVTQACMGLPLKFVGLSDSLYVQTQYQIPYLVKLLPSISAEVLN